MEKERTRKRPRLAWDVPPPEQEVQSPPLARALCLVDPARGASTVAGNMMVDDDLIEHWKFCRFQS